MPPPGAPAKRPFSPIVIGVAIGLAALALLLVVASLLDDPDDRRYPQAVRQEFIQACVANGGPEGTCECILERFEARYTLEEFIAIDEQATTDGGTLPPEAQSDIEFCAARES